MTQHRTMTDGLLFPEGPIAMPDGTVLVVEIARGTLTRVFPDGRKEIVAETGGGPNGAAIGPDGKCYICNNGGFKWQVEANGNRRSIGQSDDYVNGRIERVDLDTGAVEVLYDSCGGWPLRGPNDIVFDRGGGFWFTDLGKVREREIDRGGVYYARSDGSFIREAVHPFLTANGIGLSPDEKTLYVAETEGARLWAYPITGEGELGTEPFPPSLNGGRLVTCDGGWRRFDSLALEASGNVCVATLMTPGITVAKPDGGTLEFVELDDPLHHQHLFRRSRLENRVRDVIVGGPPRRHGLAAARSAAQLPQHLTGPRPRGYRARDATLVAVTGMDTLGEDALVSASGLGCIPLGTGLGKGLRVAAAPAPRGGVRPPDTSIAPWTRRAETGAPRGRTG